MKKSLFALAAAGAFAGAAQAQSSVTVYGILDVGYTGGNFRTVGTTGALSQGTVSRISNSMESGSRIGFRGNEDLGGGTSAQFVFELGIQPAGNAGSNPNGASGSGSSQSVAQGAYQGQGSAVWNPNVRQAFVALSQKGMGQVRVGTQNTLFWEQAGSNTTGQLAQTLGSVLAPTTSGAFFDAGPNATTLQGSALGSYTERTTNTINFRSERMSGLMAKASYTLSNQTTNRTAVGGTTAGYTGGTSNQSGWQVALDWNIQKANIQASYAAFTSENPYAATNPQLSTGTYTSNSPGGWGNGTQGTNIKDNQALVTASYDFGILKAYIGWTNRTQTAYYNSNVFMKRTAQEIGVRGYITKTIEGWASAGNGRWNVIGTGQPTANIVGYQAGANYWMSKRTNLYAIYGQNGTSSTTMGSYNADQYSVGVRHTF
jgi:predicted porin